MNPELRILVVDGDPDSRSGTTRSLTTAGYAVAEASTGEEALESLRRSNPRVVLLARDLPGMDGLEVCRRIRQLPAFVDVLIVMTSAESTRLEDQESALEYGADGYLAMPITDRELLARVRSYARIQDLARRLRLGNEDLTRRNEEARQTQLASLNLMEDAVSARTRVEATLEQLRASERSLATMTAMLERTGATAKVGGWELDLRTDRLFWSQETYRLHELDPSVEPSLADGISFYAPEAQPIMRAAVQACMEDGTPFDLELPFITAAGRQLWVQAQGSAILEDGKPVKLVGAFHDLTERRQRDEALRTSEERYRGMSNISITGMLQATPSGKALFANPALVRMLGYASEEDLLNTLGDLSRGLWARPEERETVLQRILEQGYVRGHETEYVRKDGTTIWVSVNATVARSPDGQPMYFQASVDDITERRAAAAAQEAMNEQLLQAQKMESIGLLAGGVAHDFNNMLAAISGNAELAIRKGGAEYPAARHVLAIQEAAQRAAKLTSQLLVFARKQPPSTMVLDLNPVVGNILTMLNPLLGEQVRVVWAPGGGLWTIGADAAQMDQVMTNLAVNARDAKAGHELRLDISTANVQLDATFVARRAPAGTVPGEYVCLRVQDNGVGMDAQTISKIFDPFFTTKAPGKGTGLGLSTVFGIVQQHDGFIVAESTPGAGTTFSLYFPRSTQPAEEATDPVGSVPRGTESILLAEDEDGVRTSTTEMLRMLVYTVHAARDGGEATAIFASHSREIHLLLTDVIMPGMNGAELKGELLKARPELKVLFMSGYTSDIIGIKGVVEPGVHFIRKPFSLTLLANAVRRALDE